jgi:hypothetical protein
MNFVISRARVQAVPLRWRGMPYEADFSTHAFQPLTASHPADETLQVQIHYGFEVLLPSRLGSGPGEFLAAFTASDAAVDAGAADAAAAASDAAASAAAAVAAAAAGAGDGGSSALWGAPAGAWPPTVFTQLYTGGECRSPAKQLRGGLSASVVTHCGECTADPSSLWHWKTQAGATGLRICNFTVGECHTTVHVALETARCPVPTPKVRIGLDSGTAPGWADVAVDGVATAAWDGAVCGGAAADGAADAGAACTTVRLPAGGATTLTLWFRVLSGAAVVQLLHRDHGLRVTPLGAGAAASAGSSSRGSSGAGGDSAEDAPVETLSVSVANVGLAGGGGTLMLSGVVVSPAGIAQDGAELEPPAASLTLRHACGAGQRGRRFGVRARLGVPDHMPMDLGWRVECE